jgi:hypothetical protein
LRSASEFFRSLSERDHERLVLAIADNAELNFLPYTVQAYREDEIGLVSDLLVTDP